MDLKDSLRRDRVQGREKEPFPRSLFAHVGGLVRRYRLGEDFGQVLRRMTDKGAEALALVYRHDPKVIYQPPLFFLATPEEYLLIEKIMASAANPYLAWAHSPEEILLSGPLHTRRPGLNPEALAARHFAELFEV